MEHTNSRTTPRTDITGTQRCQGKKPVLIFQRQTEHPIQRLKEVHTHISLNIAIREPQARAVEQIKKNTKHGNYDPQHKASQPHFHNKHNYQPMTERDHINIARQQPQRINPPRGNAMIPLPTKTCSSQLGLYPHTTWSSAWTRRGWRAHSAFNHTPVTLLE